MEQNILYEYLLILGDSSMILGHRLSELCGHGPTLETDIALTNISLDFFGQVRSYFQYAAELRGNGATEDSIAYLRSEREHRNVILVEQSNEDFAHVICRQYLFDVYHLLLLEQLMESTDDRISAIASKSIKEARYHVRFSSEWMKRLALGTKESRSRLLAAMSVLYPYTSELYNSTAIEKAMQLKGIGANLEKIGTSYKTITGNLFSECDINTDNITQRVAKGKEGYHTEKMGYILSDFQFMQRAYPNMAW